MSDPNDMACQELVEVITDYLERTMPAVDRRRFERHLRECPGCRSYLEQMRTIIRLTGNLRMESLSPATKQGLLEGFRGWEARSRPAPVRQMTATRTSELQKSAGVAPAEVATPADEAALAARLRDGDESAFVALVSRHSGAMLRTALVFTGSRAAAEEVVQDTWLAVIRGIDRFEGRSTLKTWLFCILVKKAKSQALLDRRVVPFSALTPDQADERPSVPLERFLPPDHERWPGHWSAAPESWASQPEERLLAAESMAVVRQAIESLPPAQQAVISLRDVHGWSAEEVCDILQVTPANQRVLLHRARSCVRARLEKYLADSSS
jgi:RNA polymerase sigma-70 factor (ECF subfamily)